ncbi:hypothetical protein BC939DRAFT_467812 [Gamsiella multidivaricata]|uniref:uncharacterized protein n=1 Tax=Gamsiella multidivaricata TaxID=101098 RepID=UPI0022201C66|nr:uncharacterized protein BC939DRAFT_467812 [Gamsiella multidivaricata]KAG0356044.1 hypothetical protein BGZ54_000860 [Gamsiella multidivaricata]KAI7816765.1 hypothetical protein BC939DRAFT_467812 [Gamsiella multidivaricata]
MPNPLELPEILSLIGEYLRLKDALSCIRVCKSWKAAFLPSLWRRFTFAYGASPSQTLLEQNAHHIRSLIIENPEPTYLATLFSLCRQLEDISLPNDLSDDIYFESEEDDQDGTEEEEEEEWSYDWSCYMWSCFSDMVRENPRLRKIVIQRDPDFDHSLHFRPRFVKALVSCSSLKVLQTADCAIDFRDSERYIQAISRGVEHLSSIHDGFVGFKLPANLTFPKIRHFDLRGTEMSVRTQLSWISKCPNLVSLFWECMYIIPVGEFCQAVKTKWPHLTALHLMSPNSREDMTLILMALPRVEKLSMARTDFDALKRHLPTLREIDLQHSRHITSHMVQQILTSCPQLESIVALNLDYQDIVRKSWKCVNLRRFDIGITIDKHRVKTHKLLKMNIQVYGRLAQFKKLEYLSICGCRGWEDDSSMLERRLKVSLRAGLGHLTTLKNLKFFSCKNAMNVTISKRDGEKVAQWMMKHWKNLETLEGSLEWRHQRMALHYDPLMVAKKRVSEMLQRRDIEVITQRSYEEESDLDLMGLGEFDGFDEFDDYNGEGIDYNEDYYDYNEHYDDFGYHDDYGYYDDHGYYDDYGYYD